MGDGKETWAELTDLGSEERSADWGIGTYGHQVSRLTGSPRKPEKHIFCDSVGNLETGAEVQ